jgi:hypothetical protein
MTAIWRAALVAGVLVSAALFRSVESRGTGQQSSPAVGTAVVAGVVVAGDPQAPVPFARVSLASSPSGSSRTIVAGEDGRFVFEAVRAGSYFLAASKPAFVPVYYQGTGPAATSPGPPFVLSDGQRLGDVALTLVRGGVIAGRVLDPYGEPAVQAQINIRSIGAQPFRNSPVYFPPQGSFTTDVHGMYRVYGLPPGDYIVFTTAYSEAIRLGSSAGPVVSYVPGYFSGVTDPAQATSVSVAAGEERSGIDLKLQLSTIVNLEGMVTAPVDINPMSITMGLRPERSELSGTRTVSVHAASDGRFRAEKVSAGNYWLTAYAILPRSPGAQPGVPTPLFWAAMPVSVQDRDVSGLALTMQPSMTVAGRVRVDNVVAGVATDPKQWLVSLAAAPEAPPIIGILPAVGRADSDGAFTVTNVTPGRYRFAVRSQTVGVICRITSITLGGQLVPDTGVEISAGTSLAGVVISIRVERPGGTEAPSPSF